MATFERRITKKQKLHLVRFLERHKAIIEKILAEDKNLKVPDIPWNIIAKKLNALGGAHKNGEGWRKAWANMKCKARQKVNESKMCEETMSGGGEVDKKSPYVKDIDEQIVSLGDITMPEYKRISGSVEHTEVPPDLDEDMSASSVENIQIELLDKPTCEEESGDDQQQQPTTSKNNPLKSRKRIQSNDWFEKIMFETEREILLEKRRKNDIAERALEQLERQNNIAERALKQQVLTVTAIENLATSFFTLVSSRKTSK